mmetsp:Transcript_17267/g.51695  ORF Transcript_17267/g.51695 Transcript_17267/m.51695 type:complete len:230 (-) Transcript_17267:846-1535(-)
MVVVVVVVLLQCQLMQLLLLFVEVVVDMRLLGKSWTLVAVGQTQWQNSGGRKRRCIQWGQCRGTGSRLALSGPLILLLHVRNCGCLQRQQELRRHGEAGSGAAALDGGQQHGLVVVPGRRPCRCILHHCLHHVGRMCLPFLNHLLRLRLLAVRLEPALAVHCMGVRERLLRQLQAGQSLPPLCLRQHQKAAAVGAAACAARTASAVPQHALSHQATANKQRWRSCERRI